MVCSEMVEEEEEDYNCGGIIDPCDELKTSKEAEESPMIVEAEPQIENESLKILSTIEDDLTDSSNFIQRKQQENETIMIDDFIETRSTQTIDDYPPENDYKLNDIINFSSPTTYDECPQN